MAVSGETAHDPGTDLFHPVPKPIITLSRAHIRLYHPRDIPRLASVANNPNIGTHLRNRWPYPYTLSNAEFWVRTSTAQDPATSFCICTSESDEHGEAGEVIGGIGLKRGEDVHYRSWELGYWLAEPYWGRGIASEATRALVNWAFEALGDECQRIFAGVFAENAASQRVLEKAGFVYEGRLRASVWKHGRAIDQLEHSVIRADWEREKEKWRR